jgi:hypothetical protein
MDGLFHGKSEIKMDNDWGYFHLWKPPHGITPMNEDAGRNGKTTCKVQPETGHIG